MNLRIFRTLAIAGATLAVAPAAAQAACPDVEPMSRIFEKAGDTNYYFVAPGGSFESGGFTTTGSVNTVDPDHSFEALGDGRAVALANGATVTTGAFCVDNSRPHLRFVARAGTTTSSVNVEAVDAAGVRTPLGTLTSLSATLWQPTAFVPLAPRLAIPEGGDKQVRIRLVATNGWRVDGIAIDPYRY